MLKRFSAVWITYWLVYLILPVSSIYPNTIEAFIVQLTFVVSVVAGCVAVDIVLPHGIGAEIKVQKLSGARRIATWCMFLSCIGIAALVYDKVHVQGIDYSHGLAAARQQWRRLGVSRDGAISSMYSVVGYALSSLYFVSLMLALTQRHAFTLRRRLAVVILSFILLMISSILAGGRSNILLGAAFFAASLGSVEAGSIRYVFSRLSARMWIYAGVGLGAGYTVYVFYSRAQAGDTRAVAYALGFYADLGLKAAPWFKQFVETTPGGGLLAMIVLAFAYIEHSFASVSAIVSWHLPGDKTLLFAYLDSLASRLGLMAPPDTAWPLAGKFPSLPGELLYQFGWLGFLIASAIVGFLSALVKAWFGAARSSLLRYGVYLSVECVLLLSPLIFAGDVMSFPFIVASFVMVGVVVGPLRQFALLCAQTQKYTAVSR